MANNNNNNNNNWNALGYGINAQGEEMPVEMRTMADRNQYFWKMNQKGEFPEESEYSDYQPAIGDDPEDMYDFHEYVSLSKAVDLAEGGHNPTVEEYARDLADTFINTPAGELEDAESRSIRIENKVFDFDTWQSAPNGLRYTPNDILQGAQVYKYRPLFEAEPEIPDEVLEDRLDALDENDDLLDVPRDEAIEVLRQQEIAERDAHTNHALGAFNTSWTNWQQQGWAPQNLAPHQVNRTALTNISDSFALYERHLKDLYAFDRFKNAKTLAEENTWSKMVEPDRMNAYQTYLRAKSEDEKKE